MRSLALLVLGALSGACQPRTIAEARTVEAPLPPAAPAGAPEADAEPSQSAAARAPSSEPAQARLPVEYDADDAHLDDEPEDAQPQDTEPGKVLIEHPLAGWSDARFEAAVLSDAAALGSMSFGSPSGGALRGGVHMPDGDGWELVDPDRAWGTEETVNYLQTAIRRVQAELPGPQKLYIGHISAQHGGHLRPHVSHQSGRDVDISYFYTGKGAWYARAHAGNLDRPRTWAFVKALLAETDVEMLLIDHSIQALLRDYALAQGEDREWVDGLFVGRGSKRPVIRHAPGHATHMHIRFFNPIAQETARRAYPVLIKHKKMTPPPQYLTHLVKPGETLGMLARKYGTSVDAIKRANGLKNNTIRAKRAYRIPVSGRGRLIVTGRNPLLIPNRRIPPERTARPEPQAAR